MKILVIAQNPSKKNLDVNVPLVGTKSLKIFLAWCKEMFIEECFIINASDKLGKVSLKDANLERIQKHVVDGGYDKIVCLGKYAEKSLKKACPYIRHYTLPHPSGLNRKLNNKHYVKAELTNCLRYLVEP